MANGIPAIATGVAAGSGTHTVNEKFSKASLRKDLESWRGQPFTKEELKGFDLKNILGASCQLQVVHNVSDGKTYANIAAVMGLPKGVKGGEPENDLHFFSFEDEQEPPEGTPEWIVELIHQAAEWGVDPDAPPDPVAGEQMAWGEEEDDGLPF